MAPHQQRVIDEREQLQERLTKLLAFFQTPAFAALDSAERVRMPVQARYMRGYSAVLAERIAAFRQERDAEGAVLAKPDQVTGAVMARAEPVRCWKTD